MTNKDFWLRLLSENDTALASVIILAERYAKPELSENEISFISEKKNWLYEEAKEEAKDILYQGRGNVKMQCKNCNNRESIDDDELCDIVGYKCNITGSIIDSDVEDGIKEYCDDCPLN